MNNKIIYGLWGAVIGTWLYQIFFSGDLGFSAGITFSAIVATVIMVIDKEGE